MYKCKICGNTEEFEEINVVKTYVKQNKKGNIETTNDEFSYRESVICLNCNATLEDDNINEIPE